MVKAMRIAAIGLAMAGAATLAAPMAHAEVGRGYLEVPGAEGGGRAGPYRDWLRISGRYWGVAATAPANGTGAATARGVFSTPVAPREGPGELVIAIDKRSPGLAAFIAKCAQRAQLPELKFAESADDFRNPALQLGARPATIPPFFEYRLKGVRIDRCPVAATAPEQAFVLTFTGIEWLNYDDDNPRMDTAPATGRRARRKAETMALAPATLRPPQATGQVKTFVVKWLGFANDVSAQQCPLMSKKPLAEDFGIPEITEAQLQVGSNPLENRGPGALSVCLLPGIAPDPGNPAPATATARGLNLDGNDGKEPFPPITCPHKNYVSDSGERGIDNQFYTVAGCIPGLQGFKGLWQQVLNEEWRSGAVSLLIQVGGIDNEQNDESVDVTVLYSEDDPEKDPQGKDILSDYTFRVSDKPEFTHHFARLPARIVDGEIIVARQKELAFNMVKGPALKLSEAGMRLKITPEGNLKGILGGYQNWRYIANYYNSVGFEVTFGFQCPGFYNGLKRAADGMRDPETGEFDGISVAYDIDAVPAFVAQ